MARRLDRLQGANVTGRGVLTWSQRVAEQIESNFADIEDAIAAAQAAADAAAAAAADALAASTAAAAAQTTANTVKRDDAISGSWTSPGNVLSATDAGSNATITIAAHTRKYGDATSVSVNGGSLTGKSYSTKYYVYYDQTSRAGGAVSYVATTSATTASYNAAAGRHFMGTITTPAAGGGSTSGGPTPPGDVDEYTNID